MDKGEGLEQRSNDWEKAKRKHIDMGAYQKILRKAIKKKKRMKKKRKLKLPSLKYKSKVKEGKHLSSLGRAKEISLKERHNKSQYQKKRLSYKRWLLLSIIKPTMLSDE